MVHNDVSLAKRQSVLAVMEASRSFYWIRYMFLWELSTTADGQEKVLRQVGIIKKKFQVLGTNAEKQGRNRCHYLLARMVWRFSAWRCQAIIEAGRQREEGTTGSGRRTESGWTRGLPEDLGVFFSEKIKIRKERCLWVGGKFPQRFPGLTPSTFHLSSFLSPLLFCLASPVGRW